MTGSWGRLPSGMSTAERAATPALSPSGPSYDVADTSASCGSDAAAAAAPMPPSLPPVVPSLVPPPALGPAIRPADEARYRQAERRWWDAMKLGPTEHWVELPGLGTVVRVLEVGEGPPVLFLHGASSGATSWVPLAARLASRHRCLLVDRPGCGLSPASPEALRFGSGSGRRRADAFDGFAALADELAVAVLDGLGVERAALVATSLGGYVALRAAAAHPDRVERLVCLGWPVGAPGDPVPLTMRLASIGRLGRAGARLPVQDRTVRRMLKAMAIGADALGPAGVAWYQALLRRTPTVGNELAAVPPVLGLRGQRAEALLPDAVLRRIQAPTLFVWGTDDPFGGTSVAEAFAPRVPGARLSLVGTGHAPWIDAPQLVALTTASFLAGHDD